MRAAAPLLAPLLLLLAGCASGPGPPAAFDIGMPGVRFDPASFTVTAGTLVVWGNNGTLAHTVTSEAGGPLDSPTLVPDQEFRFTFAQPGIYPYYCRPHAAFMRGNVTVLPATS